MNNVLFVGRLTKDPEISETENGYKRTFIVLAVPRNYKNANGEYDCDFIKCILWNATAEHTCEYCKKGDIVGVKGRLESSTYEKDGVVKYESQVVVDKISFLKTSKENITPIEGEE